jgi:hypothetical protein
MLDDGALSISTPHTITALRINGVWQAAGTYTPPTAPAASSGSGSLIVTTDGPTGFPRGSTASPRSPPTTNSPPPIPTTTATLHPAARLSKIKKLRIFTYYLRILTRTFPRVYDIIYGPSY